MITTTMKRKIIDEVVSFEVALSITSGAVLEKIDGLWVNKENPSDVYDESEVVVASYNKDVRTRIFTYAKTLLSKRGIKDINKIGKNDDEVKSIVKNMRLDNRQLGLGATIDDSEYQSAIELVKDKYESMYTTTVFQVIYWAMLRSSMFKRVNQGQNKGIACRFDLTVPDEYWEDKFQNEAYDEIDEIIFSELPTPIKLRQNDSLEQMVALATALVGLNENLSAKIGELAAVVFASFSLESEDYDDAGMFRTELVRILPRYLVKENHPVNRGIAGSRVFINAEKTRESEQAS